MYSVVGDECLSTGTFTGDVVSDQIPIDFGWSGWEPANQYFCDDVVPVLKANNVTIPRELQNDCDPGDRKAAFNASVAQG